MPEPIVADAAVGTMCGRCEELRSTLHRTDNGDQVCTDCVSEHYWTCDFCDLVSDRGIQTDERQDICAQCIEVRDYAECDACPHVSINLRPTDYDTYVCQRCVSSRGYRECDDCTTLIDSGTYCQSCLENLPGYREGDCNCLGCRASRGDDGDDDDEYPRNLINSYMFKPAPVFHGDGPTWLGLELEIECDGDRGDDARTAVDYLGDVGYLKSDGSINYGFEIVTHPMSYDWAMSRFPWQMLDELEASGANGDNTGLHVHISRSGFGSPCHTYRWLKFIHRNADEVRRLARRSSNEWAPFHAIDRRRAKDYAKGARNGNRYQAVNIQNVATLELRVFAASLKRQEVQAALGFAAASVEYTRDLTVADIAKRDGWSWSAFVEWLADRPEYAPLRAELESLACAC